MSYAAKDTSVQDAQPLLMFAFVQGAATWNLTSNAYDITKNSVPWQAGVVAPDKFGQSTQIARNVLSLRIPLSTTLAATFLGDSPDVLTSVTVYRGHVDDDEVLFYWKGRVVSTNASPDYVTLECESIFSSLRRMGPGRVWQRPCPYVFLGAGCMLDPDDFDEAVTVTGLAGAGAILTITEAEGHDDLVGSTFEAPDGTQRTIIAHDGATVTLSRKIRSLVTELSENPGGFAAKVYPFCDHSFEMCRDTYDNLANYGGQVGLPEVGPSLNIWRY